MQRAYKNAANSRAAFLYARCILNTVFRISYCYFMLPFHAAISYWCFMRHIGIWYCYFSCCHFTLLFHSFFRIPCCSFILIFHAAVSYCYLLFQTSTTSSYCHFMLLFESCSAPDFEILYCRFTLLFLLITAVSYFLVLRVSFSLLRLYEGSINARSVLWLYQASIEPQVRAAFV